jgi:uncharacterized protein
MTGRFIRFLAVVTAFLAVSSYYVGSRFIDVSPWAAAHSTAIITGLAAFVMLQFAGPLMSRVLPGARHHLVLLHWATYASLGLFACLLFYTFVADIAILLWGFAFGPGRIDEYVFGAVGAVVLGTLAIGTIQAALGPRIYRVQVQLDGLPAALEGFRIVQISDLHLGIIIGRRYAERVVRLANSLAPDAVALTGDFVDGTVDELREAAAPLGQLRAREGTFFITGNHEYYWGVGKWLEEFRRLGLRPLLNEHVVVRRGGEELVLAGVTDTSVGASVPGHDSDPARALRSAPQSAVKVLLAHHPESHVAAAAAGVDLQLSGHTHGGQFFPFSVFVRWKHRYYKGLYRVGTLWLYVNRGTGFWGPPLRFGVPAEITLVELKRA